MEDTVRMILVGDISLNKEPAISSGSGVAEWAEPFLDVKPFFCKADLKIGNLESPLFIISKPNNKRNVLGVPPSSVEALNYLGFSALNLANNHITDQGVEGIKKTCDILSDSNISHFGAGENLDDALRPAFARSKELSFAFLGYAAGLSDVGARMATKSQAGCAPLSLDRIEQDIASIHDKVTHVVVSLHWGYQFDRYPEPQQIEMARKIIDLGALIVYGHHTHILQGIQRYQNGLILYSLGNFFFPDFKRTDGCWFKFPKESSRTVIAQCEIGSDGVHSVSMVHLLVGSDYRIRVLHKDEAVRAQTAFERLSTKLNTVNYSEHWSRHHKYTKVWRRRTERKIWVCGVLAIWKRVRARGLIVSLTRLRMRHLIEFLRLIYNFLYLHRS